MQAVFRKKRKRMQQDFEAWYRHALETEGLNPDDYTNPSAIAESAAKAVQERRDARDGASAEAPVSTTGPPGQAPGSAPSSRGAMGTPVASITPNPTHAPDMYTAPAHAAAYGMGPGMYGAPLYGAPGMYGAPPVGAYGAMPPQMYGMPPAGAMPGMPMGAPMGMPPGGMPPGGMHPGGMPPGGMPPGSMPMASMPMASMPMGAMAMGGAVPPGASTTGHGATDDNIALFYQAKAEFEAMRASGGGPPGPR